MATRTPLAIVKEYLEPTEPLQVRKNALTALAALGTEESLDVLVEIAISDPDPQIRERAEAELAGIESAAGVQPAERIYARLADPTWGRRAYALLGRLRDFGLSFSFRPVGLLKRVGLARSLAASLYPERGFKFNFRGLKGLSAGMLLGSLLMTAELAYVLRMEVSAELVGQVIGVGVVALVSTLLILAVSFRFTVPAALQPDPLAATLVQITMLVGTAVGLVVIVVFLDSLGAPLKDPAAALTILLGTGSAAVGVTIGALAAFGVSRNKAANYLTQIVVGGLCGVGLYELVMVANGKGASMPSVGWAFVLYGAFGLAGAFADIDRKARPKPVVRTPVRVGVFAFAAVPIVLTGLVGKTAGDTQIQLGPLDTLPRTVEVRSVPATITYAADVPTETSLDDANNYAVSEEERGTDGGRRSVAARVTRTDLGNPGRVWFAVEELGKIRTWPQLKARLKGQQPTDGVLLTRVTIEVAPDCTPKPITVGETIQGTLTGKDCRLSGPLPLTQTSRRGNRYAFKGSANQTVTISMRAQFDTYLSLLDQEGTQIASNDDFDRTNSRIQLALPAAGTYVIEATSPLTGSTGQYTVTLQ